MASDQDFILTMFDPWGQVVRECVGCANGAKIPQYGIALTYAIAIRQDVGNMVGARSANEAIVAAFGMPALNRIKTLAWGYVTGTHDPATGKRIKSGEVPHE